STRNGGRRPCPDPRLPSAANSAVHVLREPTLGSLPCAGRVAWMVLTCCVCTRWTGRTTSLLPVMLLAHRPKQIGAAATHGVDR
ncbi:hypothetical protein, partial [Micromonospora sp. CPCC 206061]|uniref:hypothetical protein n=1 Tax=Micromonospora sp. CPCC 206061 TaxID=3122410 RepID=UPI002FF23BD4